MKKLTHNLNIKEGVYNTPSIDIVEVVAERGLKPAYPVYPYRLGRATTTP